jgi:hypothetical protein
MHCSQSRAAEIVRRQGNIMIVDPVASNEVLRSTGATFVEPSPPQSTDGCPDAAGRTVTSSSQPAAEHSLSGAGRTLAEWIEVLRFSMSPFRDVVTRVHCALWRQPALDWS